MGGWASKIVRPNRAFSTSLEPETENVQGDVGLLWFHLYDSFVTNIFCMDVFLPKFWNWEFVPNAPSSKIRNLDFVPNAPFSKSLYDPVNK